MDMPYRELKFCKFVRGKDFLGKHFIDILEVILDCIPNDPPEPPAVKTYFFQLERRAIFWNDRAGIEQFSPIRLILFRACQTIKLRMNELRSPQLVDSRHSGQCKELPFFESILVPLVSFKPNAGEEAAVIFYC